MIILPEDLSYEYLLPGAQNLVLCFWKPKEKIISTQQNHNEWQALIH